MDATPRGKAHSNNICSLRDDNWTANPAGALKSSPHNTPTTAAGSLHKQQTDVSCGAKKKGLLSFDVDVY